MSEQADVRASRWTRRSLFFVSIQRLDLVYLRNPPYDFRYASEKLKIHPTTSATHQQVGCVSTTAIVSTPIFSTQMTRMHFLSYCLYVISPSTGFRLAVLLPNVRQTSFSCPMSVSCPISYISSLRQRVQKTTRMHRRSLTSDACWTS